MTRNAIALLVLVPCAACSSIIEGTSQEIQVNTYPSGASCTLLRNGQPIATIAPTPGSALIKKTKNDVSVVCDKPGYARATTLDRSGAAVATAGDIMLPGVGWAIDSASGADNKYDTPVNVTLAQSAPPPPASPPAAPAATQAAAMPAGYYPVSLAPSPAAAPPAPQTTPSQYYVYYPGTGGGVAAPAAALPAVPPGYAIVALAPQAAAQPPGSSPQAALPTVPSGYALVALAATPRQSATPPAIPASYVPAAEPAAPTSVVPTPPPAPQPPAADLHPINVTSEQTGRTYALQTGYLTQPPAPPAASPSSPATPGFVPASYTTAGAQTVQR
jgi:hypothetical protein